MSKFLGTLIRRERLRQNISLEGLCQGICAISYLSKIEQGKAEAAPDILQPLLDRLGIRYETDPAFLEEAERTIECLYENLYSGLSWNQDPKEQGKTALLGRRERFLASPYMLDTLLLEDAFLHNPPAPELQDFASCMNSRQYELYLLLQLWQGRRTAAEELLRLNPCPYFTCQVGIRCYREGRYLEAIELLNRAYDLAAREGYIYLMCSSRVFLGFCCSDSGKVDLMLDHFRVVRRLVRTLRDGETWLSDLNYNAAITYLECGRAEEALQLLQGVKQEDALYFHKLAVALEKLDRTGEALEAVAKSRTADPRGVAKEVLNAALELVEYRLRHRDYLRDGIYSSLMSDTFALLRREASSGFVRFHLPYMLEVLEAERRYKDAYRLSSEFFRTL